MLSFLGKQGLEQNKTKKNPPGAALSYSPGRTALERTPLCRLLPTEHYVHFLLAMFASERFWMFCQNPPPRLKLNRPSQRCCVWSHVCVSLSTNRKKVSSQLGIKLSLSLSLPPLSCLIFLEKVQVYQPSITRYLTSSCTSQAINTY